MKSNTKGEFKKRSQFCEELFDHNAFWGQMTEVVEMSVLDEARKEFEELIQHFPDMHDYFEEEAKKVADNWRDNALKPIILKWFGNVSNNDL